MNETAYHAGWGACLYVDQEDPRSKDYPGEGNERSRSIASTDMKRGSRDVIQTARECIFAPLLHHDGEARRASRVGALDR